MSDMNSSGDLILVLAFDTDNPEFTRGFEAGMLWGRMIHEHEIDQTVHAANTEMVIRMAEVYGWTFTGEVVDEDWLRVSLRSGAERTGGSDG